MMNEIELESKFREWWKQSFPNSPPGQHALATHVGWGRFLLEQVQEQQNREQGPTDEEILQWLRNDRTWGFVIAPTEWRHEDDALLDLIQRAIARWGRPITATLETP